MDRRILLKSAASSAVSLGLLAGGTPKANGAHGAATPAGSAAKQARAGDFIETVDRVRIAYSDWGSGPAIVFIHAWALPSAMWDYQIAALSHQGLRCVTYDRRGHGRSDKPGSGYDCDTLADDLSALLTQLDLNEVTLVSHSFGSAEVVRYLTRHGTGRIKRIVMIAPAATPFVMKSPDNPGGIPQAQLEFFRAKVLQGDFPKWLEEGKQAFFAAAVSPGLQDWIKGLMLTTPLPVAIESNRQVTSTDFRKELPGVSVPTLIIHGDRDTSATIDFNGRPTAALIPKAELKVYEGAAHGLFLTHKDRLNEDIAAFVKA
jgi:pimeloyl-ACP methyl ester carboxylesterase